MIIIIIIDNGYILLVHILNCVSLHYIITSTKLSFKAQGDVICCKMALYKYITLNCIDLNSNKNILFKAINEIVTACLTLWAYDIISV